jgi:small subunit ribosomal protein S2
MVLPDTVKDLLENGVHFGHLSKHWNPKMKKFIFGKKKNVYIIDLEKTAQKLQEARDFAKQKAQAGERILFVATKKQLRGVIKELATSCGMPYVVERWVGGLLTNFDTIRSRIDRYLQLREKREKGEFDSMTKKEVIGINRELERMEKRYSGVVSLDSIPACVYVVDPKKEMACVREVHKLAIPIIALIDTDADPEIIDYPVPGNDDSIKSVKYITASLTEAIKEGLEKADKISEETASFESTDTRHEEDAGSQDEEDKLEDGEEENKSGN